MYIYVYHHKINEIITKTNSVTKLVQWIKLKEQQPTIEMMTKNFPPQFEGVGAIVAATTPNLKRRKSEGMSISCTQ